MTLTRWTACLLCALIASAAPLRAIDPEPLGSPSAAAAPNNPFGFRGDGTGRFPAATPPTHWSPDKNIRWSAAVGPSYSSPILAGDCVIVSAEPDLLIALDRATGKEHWRLQTTPADLPEGPARVSAAAYQPQKNGSGLTAATLLTDGHLIYTVFANGIIRAVTLEGRPQWITCIDAPQNTAYGRAASPILVDGKLIVHMTGLYAFDPATGKQLWANTEAKSTYATPASLKVGPDHLIITPDGDAVRAADGKTLASSLGSTQQSSPLVAPDGTLYFATEPTTAIRLSPAHESTELWSAPGVGETFGSPVLLDDTLFLVSGNGQLFAFDTHAKGDAMSLIDARPLIPPPQGTPEVYSSLTLAGHYLFLHTNHGDTLILEATREAKLVATNHLPAGSGASPIFSGKYLYLRAGDKLLCIAD